MLGTTSTRSVSACHAIAPHGFHRPWARGWRRRDGSRVALSTFIVQAALAFLVPPSPASAQNDDEETTIRTTVGNQDEETTVLAPRPKAGPVEPGFGLGSARFNGYVYEKAAFDTRHEEHGEDVFDFRTRLSLSLEVTRDDMTRAFVSARMSHFAVGETAPDGETWLLHNSRNVKFEDEVELGEAYVYIPSDLVNLRIGNQIVRWGFGEFNKPGDVLNPVDFREGLFSDLEIPLLPVFMVHADRTFGPVNVSAVWIPFFTPNRANLFGQDWAPMSAVAGNPAFASLSGMEQTAAMISSLAGPQLEDRLNPILLATDPPEERIENSQGGAKIQGRALGIDWSVSYFYGFDKLPWTYIDLEFVQSLQSVSTLAAKHPELLQEGMAALNPHDLFRTSYRRQQTMGLSWSAVLFDRVGLKFDSAFSPSRTVYAESPCGFFMPAAKPAGSYSVGLDYAKSTWFDVLAEFYHFHVFDMDAGEEVFLIGNDLYMITLASHLRFLEFERLELQLAGMLQFPARGLFAFPKLSYRFTDDLRAGIGMLLIEMLSGGDAMSPAGLFDRNDSVYAEFKWSF